MHCEYQYFKSYLQILFGRQMLQRVIPFYGIFQDNWTLQLPSINILLLFLLLFFFATCSSFSYSFFSTVWCLWKYFWLNYIDSLYVMENSQLKRILVNIFVYDSLNANER